MKTGLIIVCGVTMLMPMAARSTETRPVYNNRLNAVLNCRAVVEPKQRLDCFDKAADDLGKANQNHDIVVVDQTEIVKARRSLFGFNLPRLRIFGTDQDLPAKAGSDGLQDDEKEITSTIASARRDGDGYWVITLADGQVWSQTGGALALSPRPGGEVTIRRAALGSYFIRVGKQPGVKGRRER